MPDLDPSKLRADERVWLNEGTRFTWHALYDQRLELLCRLTEARPSKEEIEAARAALHGTDQYGPDHSCDVCVLARAVLRATESQP